MRALERKPSTNDVFDCRVDEVEFGNGDRVHCTFTLNAKKHVWVCVEMLKTGEYGGWLFVDKEGRRYSYESRSVYEQAIMDYFDDLDCQRVEMGPGRPPVRVSMAVDLKRDNWLFVQLAEPHFLVYDSMLKGVYTVQYDMLIWYYDTADQRFDSRQARWLVTLPGTMSVR